MLIDNKRPGCSATLGYYGPGAGAHSINLEGATDGYLMMIMMMMMMIIK